jgi:hypothetical protein
MSTRRRAITVAFATLAVTAAAGAARAAQVFVPLAPCRVIDTRTNQGGTGIMTSGEVREFQIAGTSGFEGPNPGGCGVPQGNPAIATAVVLNVVAVTPSGQGNLRAWAVDGTEPLASIINFSSAAGTNLANAVTLPIKGVSGDQDINIRASFADVHVVGDVLGYFTEAAAGEGLDRTGGTTGPFAFAIEESYQLPQDCASNGDVPTWNGTGWDCDAPTTGTGDLESVASANGSVTVTNGGGPNVDVAVATAYALPQGCSGANVVPKWDGDSWECAADTDTDTNSGGVVVAITSPDSSLTVGGTATNPTLVVAGTHALPQAGCDDGDVVVWETGGDPDVWTCVAPGDLATGDGVATAYMARVRDLSTSTSPGHTYAAANGISTASDTNLHDQRVEMLSPATACTARNLLVRQIHKDEPLGVATVGTANAKREFYLTADGVDTAVWCEMEFNESTCESTGTALLAPGTRVAIHINAVQGGGSHNGNLDAMISWECAAN